MSLPPAPDNPAHGSELVATTAPPHRKSGDTTARILGDQVITNAQVIADHHGEKLAQQGIIISLVKLANKGCHKIGLAAFDIILENQFLDTANN